MRYAHSSAPPPIRRMISSSASPVRLEAAPQVSAWLRRSKLDPRKSTQQVACCSCKRPRTCSTLYRVPRGSQELRGTPPLFSQHVFSFLPQLTVHCQPPPAHLQSKPLTLTPPHLNSVYRPPGTRRNVKFGGIHRGLNRRPTTSWQASTENIPEPL